MRHNVSFMLLHHWYPDLLSSCHLILHQGRYWYQRKMGINCFFLVHLQFLRLITLRQFIFNLKQDIRALFPSDCNPFYAGFGNRDTDDFSYLKEDISLWNYWKLLPTVSIYEGVSHNFCLTSDGFGVANASSGIKLTWTFIMHIFFPDRFCKLLEGNLLRERTANFFYVFLFGAKVLTGIVLVGGMICCQSHNVVL
ncbi:uncharacterized protein LOC111994206 isoform X2 [Quercus suber]|uniref:uncharacterized protein LOC111994206 isoform X2 n=1 Tax=Quercus suber TaxID=58331 RepID=UPI0032DEBC25